MKRCQISYSITLLTRTARRWARVRHCYRSDNRPSSNTAKRVGRFRCFSPREITGRQEG